MANKTIQKNISFDNFDEFVQCVNTLKDREGVSNLNFGGSVMHDDKQGGENLSEVVLRINVSWNEEETF